MNKLLRIASVEPLDGCRLRLTLTDGSMVERDVRELLRGPVLEALVADPAAFCSVRVDAGTVVWANGADLCPDMLIWGGSPPADDEVRTPPGAWRDERAA